MSLSARGAIRAEVIDKMTDVERRALIAKTEEVVNNGQSLDPDDFEEHVGEILAGREEGEDEDRG